MEVLVQVATNKITTAHKRGREQYEDLAYDTDEFIEAFSDEEDEDIFFHDEGNTPPRKRVRGTLHLERTSFSSNIRITSQTKDCHVQFTLQNPSQLNNIDP